MTIVNKNSIHSILSITSLGIEKHICWENLNSKLSRLNNTFGILFQAMRHHDRTLIILDFVEMIIALVGHSY